jgi:hypothetical protein
MFSFARNSCSRNHRRLTLCGHHHAEEHDGAWQTCNECRENFETELFVYYGTNGYNFEKLPNPPPFKPKTCSRCRAALNLGEGGYTVSREGYTCERCADSRHSPPPPSRKPKSKR